MRKGHLNGKILLTEMFDGGQEVRREPKFITLKKASKGKGTGNLAESVKLQNLDGDMKEGVK